mmetsp:Transcript_43320/g.115888  ORF Transcript_43320/g.115888 Transcript_43320/m.115888 type:complete len:175 (+) Transcript_43320:386-910(+)
MAAVSIKPGSSQLTAQQVRQACDVDEAPVYKPLDPLEDFTPTKTCAQYVAQDCVQAIPAMQKFAQILIAESGKVAASILDLGLDGGLHPMKVFAVVSGRSLRLIRLFGLRAPRMDLLYKSATLKFEPQHLGWCLQVCYTMDLGSFGASAEDNFYFQLNKALQKRDPNTMSQLSG